MAHCLAMPTSIAPAESTEANAPADAKPGNKGKAYMQSYDDVGLLLSWVCSGQQHGTTLQGSVGFIPVTVAVACDGNAPSDRGAAICIAIGIVQCLEEYFFASVPDQFGAPSSLYAYRR